MPEQIQINKKDADQDQEIALLTHRIEDAEKMAEELRDRVSLPIVDGVVAGVNQLKMLNALNLRKPVSGSLAFPPSKKLVGLPEHLTKMFKAFGSKIDRK